MAFFTQCIYFYFEILRPILKLIIWISAYIARKVSKYGVFSGPYFPAFSPNTGKYGPEKTSYLDTFHAVKGTGINTVCSF